MAQGYDPRFGGENIARNYEGVNEVMTYFMSHSSSASEVLFAGYDHVGVAVQWSYWVLVFARSSLTFITDDNDNDDGNGCSITMAPTALPTSKPTVVIAPSGLPTQGPTEVPTISNEPSHEPTRSMAPSYCVDVNVNDEEVVGWQDADGYGCKWYSIFDPDCVEYGDCCKKDGYTARTACCVCGGGVGMTI